MIVHQFGKERLEALLALLALPTPFIFPVI